MINMCQVLHKAAGDAQNTVLVIADLVEFPWKDLNKYTNVFQDWKEKKEEGAKKNTNTLYYTFINKKVDLITCTGEIF